MEDYKFSEINETEEAKNASLSVSLQPTFSNTSQNITVDLQELKEESLEMSIQQKKLKEKYEEAKQIAFNKHFEVTQLIHQIFGTHVANIELLYESKESILGRRKQLLNQTYKRVSRANTPLFCGNGRLELTFDASSMSLHDNTINEHAIFDGNNDDYDADSIENFEFSKLKKMGKLVKQLHSIANDLKFDNALIKLKNKENKEWQKQNGMTGNDDDDDDDDDSNNNNKNNNKKNSGNDNSSSASEDDDDDEDDTVMVAYEYQAPDGNQASQASQSNESNESNDSNKSNKSSKSSKSNKLAAKSNKSKKSSKSHKNNKGSKSNKGNKPNKSAKASKTPQVHTAKKSHDKTKGGAHVLKRQVSKRRNTLSGLNGMKGLKRRSVRNVTNGKKDKNEKNGKNGKNETRHFKVKTIDLPNLETFTEMIDTVNEDNSDVSNGGSKNGGGIVTTAPNVKNVREIWEEKTRQTAKSKQRHRSQSSIRHVKTRSLSPGLQPVQMYD